MRWTYLFLISMVWLLTGCQASGITPPIQATSLPEQALSVTATPTPYLYEVQPGDTLWSIAERVGMDMEVLAVVNELDDPNQIRPGDRLLISDTQTISGRRLPTPTPTPLPCLQGCLQPPPGCVIKAYRARLDDTKLFVTPEDDIYALPQAERWFCREEDARQNGWRRWTPNGPEAP